MMCFVPYLCNCIIVMSWNPSIENHLHTLNHMNFPTDIHIYCNAQLFILLNKKKHTHHGTTNIEGSIIFHIYVDNNATK
jgi:hypothetical protein